MGKQATFRAFIEPPQKKGGMPLIAIPPDIADPWLASKNKRRMIICFDNGKQFHRALQRNKDGFCFMLLGKSTLKEARKEAGEEVEISLAPDESEFGMPMPEELAEVLCQEPEGEKAFMDLSPGLKRSFLYYINSAKTVDTRIKRSLQLINNLKQGIISAGNQAQK